ncbi:MAG: tyrosine-type recombinase/integrase [Leptospirales bacterium]
MRFSCQGKQIRRSTETTDKKLAERIYHKVLGELAQGDWLDRLPGEEKILSELFGKYLEEHSKPNKSEKSWIRDKGMVIRILKEFGDVTLVEVSPRQISEYKARRRAEGASAATVNKELSFLRHVFETAVVWEWLLDNPASRIPKEKVKNSIERWLSAEEEERLLKACPDWLREIVVFALNTGFRQGEILSLAWKQVDWSKKAILFWEQKNGGRDCVPVNESAVQVLNGQSKIRKLGCDLVFSTGNGTAYTARNVIRAFANACQIAKVENFRFHDLRHTFATRLIHAGVDMYTVQRLGRWKSLSMVLRYAHHSPESLRSGMEAVNRLPSTNLAQSGK